MNRVGAKVSSFTAVIVILLLAAIIVVANDAPAPKDAVLTNFPDDPFRDPGFDNDVLTLGSYNSDLVAGGRFFTADSSTAVRIAGWNGVNWYPFCCPSLPFSPEVYAARQYGSDLLVGAFGQTLTLHKWDGVAWGTFGTSLGDNASIYAIEEFQGQVVVGGTFRPGLIYKVATWNGSAWDSLGSGVFGAGWTIYDMLVFDSNLIVGGSFSKAGGDTALAIAQWDGANWSAIGKGLWGSKTVQTVYTMTVFSDVLFAAGDFSKSGTKSLSNIAYYNGFSWQPPFGGGLDGPVYALTVYDNKLIAGGRFHRAGTTAVDYIASWDGSTWMPVGSEIDSTVQALYVHNGILIAGGSFSRGGGGYIAAWDGAAWQAVKDLVMTCCGAHTTGYTGNTDCDTEGKRNIADVTRLIDRVYLTKTALCCEENGNTDGDIDSKLNIADITRLIDNVYLSKAETAACE